MTVTIDDSAIIEAGYQPQLERRLGFFSAFAISFSYMSVLTGIFANFGFAFGKAGAFGMWTWVLVGVGQTLTALVFAEMAGRVPLTGCSYNWNKKLTNPTIGWFAGWMALAAYTIGVAAVTVTIIPLLNSLIGFSIPKTFVPFLGLSLIALQALLNIYGVRLAAHVNLFAVSAEVLATLGFGILLLGDWVIRGLPDVISVVVLPTAPGGYLPMFLMASLLGAWTLLGFEGAADISEETVDVRRVAPRAIVRSVLICSVFGLCFSLILALCASGIPSISTASDPVSTIISSRLGPQLTWVFQGLLLLSIVACSLVNMTGASRVLFAMARDRRFIASGWLATVSPRKVPARAIAAVATVSGAFLWFSDSATALYGAGTVLFTWFYLLTVAGYAFGVRRLPPSNSFSMGKWRWAVVPLALIWLCMETAILTVPKEFHDIAVTAVMVLVIAVIVYTFFGRRSRTDRHLGGVHNAG